MLSKCPKTKGIADLVLIGILFLVGALGGAGIYEFHKAKTKNTPAPIVQTILDVKATQAAVVDLQAKNAADNAARAAETSAARAKLQDAAGYVAGASQVLESEAAPSLDTKIADLLLQQAQTVTGPATSSQLRQMAQIVRDLAQQNSALASSNENLKAIVLKTTDSLEEAKASTARIQSDYAASVAEAKTTLAAKDAAISSVTAKSKAALDESAKVNVVTLTAFERFKAWAYGLGFMTLALVGLVLLVFPILIQAFPLLKPVLTSVSNLFLKFWDMLHEAEKKAIAAAHAEVSKLLAAEVAAHSATKSALQTVVSAVSPATTPTKS